MDVSQEVKRAAQDAPEKDDAGAFPADGVAAVIDTSENLGLEELAASIRQRGLLKPILVRPNGDGFTRKK